MLGMPIPTSSFVYPGPVVDPIDYTCEKNMLVISRSLTAFTV